MPSGSDLAQPVNPFLCFLQHYREDCSSASPQNQTQLAERAGRIWRRMSDEEKCPFIEQARDNKRRGGAVEYEEEEFQARRQCVSSDGRKCNNAAVVAKKNMGHRLLECLFCQCENGNLARELLFQFQRKANEYFPDLEDETFYIYYKLLMGTMLGIGLFTVLLSLLHFLY